MNVLLPFTWSFEDFIFCDARCPSLDHDCNFFSYISCSELLHFFAFSASFGGLCLCWMSDPGSLSTMFGSPYGFNISGGVGEDDGWTHSSSPSLYCCADGVASSSHHALDASVDFSDPYMDNAEQPQLLTTTASGFFHREGKASQNDAASSSSLPAGLDSPSVVDSLSGSLALSGSSSNESWGSPIAHEGSFDFSFKDRCDTPKKRKTVFDDCAYRHPELSPLARYNKHKRKLRFHAQSHEDVEMSFTPEEYAPGWCEVGREGWVRTLEERSQRLWETEQRRSVSTSSISSVESLRPNAISTPPYIGNDFDASDRTLSFSVHLECSEHAAPTGVFAHTLRPYDGTFVLDGSDDGDVTSITVEGGSLPLAGAIHCWFFDEFGLMGRRHYLLCMSRDAVIADFQLGWAYLPKYSTILVDPPEELCDQGCTDVFNCAVLISHRALSHRPFCLLNNVPQGVGPAVRPFFISCWFPDVLVSQAVLRWTADMPFQLDGYHLFPVINDRAILPQDRVFLFSGLCIRFDVCPEPMLMWHASDSRCCLNLTPLRDDCSYSETFFDNRFGSSIPDFRPEAGYEDSSSPSEFGILGGLCSADAIFLYGGIPRENPYDGQWRVHVYFYDDQGYKGLREYAPGVPHATIFQDFRNGWAYTPQFHSRVIAHACPDFFRHVPLADVAVIWVVLLSAANLSHRGPLCLIDESILHDDPISEFSFRACWFHAFRISDIALKWVLDIPRFLRGFFVFTLVDGNAYNPNPMVVGDSIFVSFGSVISFSLHNDYGLSIAIGAMQPSWRTVSDNAAFEISFYDHRSLYGGPDYERLCARRDRTLVSPSQGGLSTDTGHRRHVAVAPLRAGGSLSIVGGGASFANSSSYDTAISLPLRIRAYFISETGFLGMREYGPDVTLQEQDIDFGRGWPFPIHTVVRCEFIPEFLSYIAFRDAVQARVILVSNGLALGRRLCLFDRSFLNAADRREFHALEAVWIHRTEVSEPCLRWVLDVPRILDGLYVHLLVNSWTVPDGLRRVIPDGAYIRLSDATPMGFRRHLRQIPVATRFTVSDDDTFCDYMESPLFGIAGGSFHSAYISFFTMPFLVKPLYFGMQFSVVGSNHTCILMECQAVPASGCSFFCVFGSYTGIAIIAGAELTQADLGKLTQKIKGLELGFSPAQIRVILLTDGKACSKLIKAENSDAIKAIFGAAAKRIGLSPKSAGSPNQASPTSMPTRPSLDEEWTTVSRKARARQISQVPASQQNIKNRSFVICPEGWSVPICLPEEVRADTASLFACDDEALARSIWAKCKASSKAIGLLAPRDLKVGSKTPTSFLVPFFEHVEGMPSRKIDLQVWLHQLSTADVTFASPRQVVDMGHASKKTSVFRARLDNTRVSANYRADFAKGNKAIMKAALTPVLGDVGLSKVLDLWSPKLDSNGQFTFFIRALSSDKDDLLRLSRPDKLILDTPIEDAARFKHVWLKAEGAPMSSTEVERLLATTNHFGAFSKQGTWALRVQEDQFADIKKALGQNSLPAYLLLGLPADYVPEQVEEFCTKLGWAVQVDPLSRRFRNKRLQWIVRASSLPPVHSTYCFTGYNRLRIDIESAARQPIAASPPRVDLNDFQTTTFAQQTARARPKIGPGRAVSNGGPMPTYAQALLGSSPSPVKPPTKRHKSDAAAAGDATPRRGFSTAVATTAFQSSPPRRFQTTSSPSSMSEMATLEARLAHTEAQLAQMHVMLTQIMDRLVPAAPIAPVTDPDAYMANGIEGGQDELPDLFS